MCSLSALDDPISESLSELQSFLYLRIDAETLCS